MTVCSQLSLVDVLKNCQNLLFSDKHIFFSLLEDFLDFSEFTPINFYNAYYQKYWAIGFTLLLHLFFV